MLHARGLLDGRSTESSTDSFSPSLSIGSQDEEATKLKTQVEYANSVAARAEEQLEQVCVLHDPGSSGVSQSVIRHPPTLAPETCQTPTEQLEQEMNMLVNQVPNLLDDRVPDGADESANVVVTEWGAERRKVGEGFLWHDDIATKLGGYDPATAVRFCCCW